MPDISRWIVLFSIILLTAGGCKIIHPSGQANLQQPVSGTAQGQVTIKPGGAYTAPKFKRFWLGDQYRDVWETSIQVPVLDFDTKLGGLQIPEELNENTAHVLKVRTAEGRPYILRAILSDPVGDQASLPYGELITSALAEQAGIPHINPELVYIPDVALLGKYRKEFGGILAIFLEDAQGNGSDFANSGFSGYGVQTQGMIRELRDDHDSKIDELAYLKARLFDIWVGDWDRNEEQYLWAGDDERARFKPIPVNRDNAFFRFDGVIPWVSSRKWAQRQFQDFQNDIRDTEGLNLYGLPMDRRFLAGLGKEQWQQVARDLRARFSNEFIYESVQRIPEPAYELVGQEIAEKLIVRRNRLEEFALRYYAALARQVDVVGTDESEYFEILRLPDGGMQVEMYTSHNDGDRGEQIFIRIFNPSETQEVRLFGLGGVDYFRISGTSEKPMNLRIIGGDGEDEITDNSNSRQWRKSTVIYDTQNGNSIVPGPDTRIESTVNNEIVRYDMHAFRYDHLAPVLKIGYNMDDKFYLGGGVVYTRHGFNQYPYASEHRATIAVAPYRSSWQFEYSGDFTDVIQKMGVNLDLTIQFPRLYTNFFGFGNSTVSEERRSYYDVYYYNFRFFPGFTGRSGNSIFKLGPLIQVVNVDRLEGTFLDENTDGLLPDVFRKNVYGGIALSADIRSIESVENPLKGVRWLTNMEWLAQTNNSQSKIGRINSEIRGYYTFEEKVPVTIAARLGAASTTGDFQFYQASTIGGTRGYDTQGNVRGYYRDRFTGRSSIFQNLEVRASVLRISEFYIPFELGVLAHFDSGRVWSEVQEDNNWHSSWGGGLYFRPFEGVAATLVYTHSTENDVLNFNLGFMF